jgi:GTP-binding protein
MVLLPKEEEGAQEEEVKGIAVAVLGRPNVGKSTLVNRILGEERASCSVMPSCASKTNTTT